MNGPIQLKAKGTQLEEGKRMDISTVIDQNNQNNMRQLLKKPAADGRFIYQWYLTDQGI